MFVNDLVRHVLALAEDGGNGGGSGGSGDAQNGGQGGGDTGSGGQGGSSDGGDRGGAGGGPGTGSGQQGGPSGGAQNGHDAPDGRSIESLPKWAQDMVRGLRDEAAGNRTKRNDAERQITDLQRKVAEAFGIDTGDGAPDPDKLAADLARAQADARLRAVELATFRAAADKGADPAALLDSRTFLDSVSDLDPNAQDFQTRLGDKITAATQNNPRLTAAGGTTGTRPGGGIGQGGRGPQSGPTGVAAGRALHPASRARQNAAT